MKAHLRPHAAARPVRRPHHSFRPRVESLEDRWVPTPSGFPVTVSTTGVLPATAFLNGNNFVVASVINPSTSGGSPTIVAQRVDTLGDLIGSQISVASSGVASSVGAIGAADDGTGNFLVAWPVSQTSLGITSTGVEAQLFNVNGAPQFTQPPELLVPLPSFASNSTVSTRAAMNSHGDFVLAEDTVTSTVFPSVIGTEQAEVQEFNSLGQPLGTGPAVLVNTTASTFIFPAANPVVAMDDAGDYVVVWNNSGQLVYQLFNSDSTASLFTPNPVSIPGATSPGSGYSVAMDSAGAFVITWAMNNTSSALGGVLAQRYDAQDNAVGSTIAVATNQLTNSADQFTAFTHPQVGMDATGAFVVAFDNDSGVSGDSPNIHAISAQQFDQSGAKVGSLLNVEPPIVSSPQSPTFFFDSPSLAENAAGSFAVGWDRNASPPLSNNQQGVQANLFPAAAAPDVTVSKTTDTPTVDAGQAADFTVTVQNVGGATATGVTFSDPLPDGVGNDIKWSIKTQSSGNFFGISGSGPGGQSLTFSPTTLAAGAGDTVEITGTTTYADSHCPAGSSPLLNTATVSAANEPTADQNQTASATVTVVSPYVTVLKTADQPTVSAGQRAGFTVTVSNMGAGIADGVTLSDPLPGGAGRDIKWQIASDSGNPTDFVITGAVDSQVLTLAPGVTSLAAGQSLSVHITALTGFADVPDPWDGASLLNTATVSATNEEPDDQNQEASATINLVSPDVTIYKAADQATISAGQSAGFTLFLNNAGGLTATGVTLRDPLPAGPGNDVNWQIDPNSFNAADFVITGSLGSQVLTLAPGVTSLDPNQLLSVNVTGLTSIADAPAPALIGFLANTVTVSATNEEPAAQNQQSSATITIVPDGVTVLKTADQPFISAGQTAGFTVAVFNVGATVATGVTLNDPLPAGAGNDLFWTIGPNSLDPNDFVITGSLGSQVLTLAPNVTSLDPGQSLSVDVTSGPTSFADAPGFNGELFNTATVNAANEPATAQNQQSFATITVSAPDVTVVKTADQAVVAPGTDAGFTVTVSNVGTTEATGVTLNDPLPAGLGNDVSWQIDPGTGNPSDFVITGAVGNQVLTLAPGATSLNPNQSLSVHVTGQTSDADAPGSLLNTATVSAGNEAPALQKQQSSATITVLVPDITVTNTLTSSSPIDAGQTVSFVVGVSNVGQTTLTGVVLSDLLPAGAANDFNWVIDTTTGNPTNFAITCTPSLAQVLTFAGGSRNLTPGQTLTVRVIGVPTSLDAGPLFSGVLTSSTATVTAVNEPAVQATTLPITVLAPDLTVTKTTDHFFIDAGQTADFTVTLSNSRLGHATATGVTLTDPLPPGAGNDVNWQIDPDTGNPSDFVITGAVGHQALTLAPGITTLPVGTTLLVRITGLTTAADASAFLSGDVTVFLGELRNTATVTASGVPPEQASSTVLVEGDSFQSTSSSSSKFRFITGSLSSSSSSSSSSLSSANAASIVAALSQPAGAASDNDVVVPPIDFGVDLDADAPLPQPAGPPETVLGSSGFVVLAAFLSGAGQVSRVGNISGVIFLDRNGNGIRDPGEPGIPGLTVFIDMHGDGVFHPDDPYTVTNAQGEYVFQNLPLDRTYQVRPVRQQYMEQTYPKKGAPQVVQLSDDHPTETDVTFGTVPFKPATPPVRPVGDSTSPMTPQPPAPAGDSGKSGGDQSRNDVPPEASDAAFASETFWRPAALPLALVSAFALGLDRRRRRRPLGRRREDPA